jgi:DNA polymerase-3 subunit delta'
LVSPVLLDARCLMLDTGCMDVFEGLIGQEGAKRVLEAGLATGSLPQALVFAGPRGVGRKTAAAMLAMALHGDNSGFQADTFWFGLNYADKVSRKVSGAIKETADDLVRFLQMSPLISKYKVAIIEDAEGLSEEAQSALLKTLEEPRADSLVILIVEDEHSLLPTILSRTQTIKFVLLTDHQIGQALGERATAEIVSLAHGSLGFAKQLFEDFDLLTETRQTQEFWRGVGDLDIEAKFGWSEKMREREVAARFLRAGLNVTRRQLLERSDALAIRRIEEIDRTLTKVEDNANVRLALDSLMLVL